MSNATYLQRGSASIFIIIGLSFFTVAFAGLSIWAFMNYTDQKDNVDAKIARAVATAEKIQGDELEEKFAQREKEPYKSFAGPSDFGTLGFKYPKTWSVYIASDGVSSGKGYEAYLNPGTVPPVNQPTSRYAIRVAILNTTYEDILDDFQARVEKGDLKSSPTKVNGQTGTRLDGNFSKDVRGAAVIYKIRDKTAIIRTDADTFKPDFETLIQTISFIE